MLLSIHFERDSIPKDSKESQMEAAVSLFAISYAEYLDVNHQIISLKLRAALS